VGIKGENDELLPSVMRCFVEFLNSFYIMDYSDIGKSADYCQSYSVFSII